MMEAYGADPTDLNNMKKVWRFLHDLPDLIDMKRLTTPYVIDADATASGHDPGGITGVAIIAESHVSIHTFADRGFFTMDVYSCSNFDDKIDIIKKFAQERFPHSTQEINIVKRGTQYPVM